MPTLNIRTLVSNTLRAARHERARLPLSAGSALMLFAFAGAAAAQQAPASSAPPADNLDEVVVTGIRHGIEAAIEVKRESGSIVEAVSAEDIGKLPDTSIAESIARLPGLTSQRAPRRSAFAVRIPDSRRRS